MNPIVRNNFLLGDPLDRPHLAGLRIGLDNQWEWNGDANSCYLIASPFTSPVPGSAPCLVRSAPGRTLIPRTLGIVVQCLTRAFGRAR
jgi:hypothetical protein